jgi:hypothetical protein
VSGGSGREKKADSQALTASSGRRVELRRGGAGCHALDPLRVLDEHLLDEAVCFLYVRVVVPLSDFSDVPKRFVPQYPAALAKGLEGVFGLASHDDVSDEPQEIALARGISKITHGAERRTHNPFRVASVGTKVRLIALEHALMLPHMRYVPRAKVAESSVLCLLLMVIERPKKCPMLHDCIVDLAFQEITSAIHV